MTPLERATAALIDALKVECHVGNPDSDGLSIIDGEIDLRLVARAVLTAIREPSEGMALISAGYEPDDLTQGYGEDFNCVAREKAGQASEAWQAMIDAALEEG